MEEVENKAMERLAAAKLTEREYEMAITFGLLAVEASRQAIRDYFADKAEADAEAESYRD